MDNGDKPTSVLPGQETSRGERKTKLTVFKPFVSNQIIRSVGNSDVGLLSLDLK